RRSLGGFAGRHGPGRRPGARREQPHPAGPVDVGGCTALRRDCDERDKALLVPAMSVAQLAPEARDFAPDLLTLQESPPSNLPRAALLLVVVLVAALIFWAVWARLDIVATAPGRLVPA